MPKPVKRRHHYGFQPSLFREGVLAALLALFTGAFEFLAAFLIWPATAVMSVVLHMEWPGSIYAIGFLVVVPVIIGALMWVLSPGNDRGMGMHVAAVSALVSALLITIDIGGFTKFAIFMLICAVPLLCLTLAIHVVMRNKKTRGLDHIFEQAGIPGANIKIHRHDEEF